jgi:hypothetical protein
MIKGWLISKFLASCRGLLVQQDAVMMLYRIITGDSIDLESLYPEIGEAREIRIRIAGHPAGGKAASHFMIRYTVSKRGFEFWAYDQTGGRTVAQVDLFDLIAKNSVALNAVLEGLVERMENEDKAHKAAFAQFKLASIFNTATYCSGKLFEGVTNGDPIGKVGSRCLRSMVNDFKEALLKRSDHFAKAGFVTHDIPILEHAIEKYDEFIDVDEPKNEHDGYILARYIQVEMSNLAVIAREIDDEYGASQSDPPSEQQSNNS